MRRLKHDWATHGWNWNYARYSVSRIGLTKEAACSFWAQTTLCDCFYNPAFKGMGRFKDTPSMGHRKRSCNGKDGDRINEYKASQRIEVEKEVHGTSQRLRKRMRRQEPRRMKVTCLCGYLIGHIMVQNGESKYTAISRRYGNRHPRCPNCDERLKRRTNPVEEVGVLVPA